MNIFIGIYTGERDGVENKRKSCGTLKVCGLLYSRFNKAPAYVLSMYGQLNLNIMPIKGGERVI